MRAAALNGIRVVDITGTIATSYCAKLCADYGAEVFNLEPEEGFPTRRLPPFVPDASPGEASATHGYLHTSKQSLLSSRLSRAARSALIAGADLVLDDGAATAIADDLLGVRSSVSWFGQGGPYEDYLGSDAQCFALNGMLKSIGHVDGPPLIPTGYQAQMIGGLTAFVGSLGQVLGGMLGNRTGPVHIETSIFESCLCFTDVGAVTAFDTDLVVPRLGVNRFPPTYPLGVFPCRDGWLGVTVLTPSQWRAFCRLLDLTGMADVPLFQTAIGRLQASDVLEPMIQEKLLLHSAEDLFYRGQHAGIPLARVPTMEELFAVDQFLERGAFADAMLPDGLRLKVPAVPFRLMGTPPNCGGAVARLGEHSETFAAGKMAPTAPAPAAGAQFRASGRDVGLTGADALKGIRIIDLSMGWAGPLATRHLADLGAEVIKVEGCERFDWWRSWEATPEWIADDGAEKSSAFNTVNRNKRNVTLDLEHADGRTLLLRLVAGAQAIVENYSGGVLPKLNLGFEQFRAVNADIVMLSMPAFGSTGPWSRFRAYGSTVEQASGLPHLNGLAEDPPTMLHVAYGDAVAGLNGAAALLVALGCQARTGGGQFVDLSQVETLFPLAVHGILEYVLTGAAPPRQGNHSAAYAPHGVYRCRGEDEWILIQAGEECQWQALKLESGGRLDGFGDLSDRMQRVDALDAAINEWTAGCESHALMARLQRAGIPAAATNHLASLLDDPHLARRGFWQWLDRAFVGRQPHPSPPYRIGAAPLPIAAPAPTLGEHNEWVLEQVLGLGKAEVERLAALGVIGTRPRMRSKSKAHG